MCHSALVDNRVR